MFLGESLHLYHAFGMALILTGLFLSRMPERKSDRGSAAPLQHATLMPKGQ
jgi:drug/metabolite transporter (DMT)-like permease